MKSISFAAAVIAMAAATATSAGASPDKGGAGKVTDHPLTVMPPLAALPLGLPELLPDTASFIGGGMSARQWADSLLMLSSADLSPDRHFSRLSEEDFIEVAEELGVEPAAIKAVVDIEAGRAHEGFYQPGKPIINFDLSMYRKFAPRHGVSLSAARKKHPEIFSRPNTRRYGSYQAAQYARLDAARSIDKASALESAFWGMFQIGGFNWKLCGCASVEEFVEKMSRSERDQLELFAQLIKNCGMLEPLQHKQWLKFALKYNGPKAKARGYHTRMASSYARHKASDKK